MYRLTMHYPCDEARKVKKMPEVPHNHHWSVEQVCPCGTTLSDHLQVLTDALETIAARNPDAAPNECGGMSIGDAIGIARDALENKDVRLNPCDHGHATVAPVKMLPRSDGCTILCFAHYLEQSDDRAKQGLRPFADWDRLKKYRTGYLASLRPGKDNFAERR